MTYKAETTNFDFMHIADTDDPLPPPSGKVKKLLHASSGKLQLGGRGHLYLSTAAIGTSSAMLTTMLQGAGQCHLSWML